MISQTQTVATRFLPRKSCPIRWFRASGAAPRREPRVAGGNGVGGGRRGGCSRAGGTIRMFPRLTQRRPAAGDCSIGANFRRRFARLFGSRCPATRVPLCDRGEAAIGSRGCGGTRIEAQQLPIESGLGATRCVAHIRERARLHRGATPFPWRRMAVAAGAAVCARSRGETSVCWNCLCSCLTATCQAAIHARISSHGGFGHHPSSSSLPSRCMGAWVMGWRGVARLVGLWATVQSVRSASSRTRQKAVVEGLCATA